jgi:putative transposase
MDGEMVTPFALWGSDRFRQQIEALTQRTVSVRPRGRPPKPPETLEK